MIVSGLSFLLVVYMIGRRLLYGPEAEGVFTLIAIVIFLISVAIMGIGIVGEYVGRIYQALCRRRYSIRTIIQAKSFEKDSTK
jgi:undecaprenyl-phosphate 4-deoxy-4-formamido-L-arabinose transferase